MTLQDLQNIRAMLNRVPLTGQEAVVWLQTVQAVEAETTKLSQPAAPEVLTA